MRSGSDADILWRSAQALAAGWQPVTPGVAGMARAEMLQRAPPLVFVTDPERTPEPWRVAANLPAGTGVIYRAFGRDDALAVGRRLRHATRGLLLVGRDLDLALAIGADGVHLPDLNLDQAEVLRRAHPHLWVSGAVHASTDPERTRALDLALIAPVFAPSPTSPTQAALGIEGFRDLARRLTCPALALGGITPQTVGQLSGAHAYGIAAVSAICQAFSGPQA